MSHATHVHEHLLGAIGNPKLAVIAVVKPIRRYLPCCTYEYEYTCVYVYVYECECKYEYEYAYEYGYKHGYGYGCEYEYEYEYVYGIDMGWLRLVGLLKLQVSSG